MYLVPEDIADRQREYRPVVIRGVVKIQYLSGYVPILKIPCTKVLPIGQKHTR